MFILTPLLFIACDPKATEPNDTSDTNDTNDSHTWAADSTLCGQAVLQESYCDLPSTIDVWTIKEGFSACAEGFGDTAGNWEDWRDSLVTTVNVDSNGYFEANLPAGEYGISGSSSNCVGCESVSITEGSCSNVSMSIYEPIYVDAPNIYLYPEAPTATHVRIANPQDITLSDPPYHEHQGWWSIAHPDGQLLTKHGWKDFLFYELVMDGRRFQRTEGWCASGKRAQLSIESAMAQYGFNAAEIQDFSDFWDAEFPVTQDYSIYPQTEQLRRLSISPEPDSFLRVWFLVEDGCKAELTAPEIPPFEPVGFYATEWGVMFSGGLEGPKLWVTGL